MSPPDTSFAPSENIAKLKESATIAVSQRAKALKAEGREIIDLGAGEPDFDTPALIRRAAQHALDHGATRYTATEGTLALRTAIAARATVRRGRRETIAPAQVVVSNGSKQSLFNACFCLFGPGDEVLIPTPSWTSYYEMVALSRATAVAVMGDPNDGFRVTPALLTAHATERTRGIMLNTPVNPTGTVYTRSELDALLAIARERGWWVICDEIYLRIAFDGDATSCLDVAESLDRVVIVDGVAKAYAMTGWRIGWTISAAPLAKAMAAFQSHTTFNAAAVSQAGAAAALTLGEPVELVVRAMVEQFRARRDAAMAILAEEPTIRVIPPEGAFYLFIQAPGAGRVSDAGTVFAAQLLEKHNVAVVPGAAFLAPDWIRVAYSTDIDQVKTAMRRIVTAFRAR
ncbi:MAG: aminotransferase class I/II-fold pyridoxal phosphate-dependent enzyme [Gemmatimonadota bacterium]|nr:aminotransferase class I/II-fold pyridoxal phosphate-dependent enzyme [Gemmatimonadota bacterium]